MNNHLATVTAPTDKTEKKFITLRAEIVRAGLTIYQFADAMKMNRPTFSNKLNGHSEFTLSECLKIKEFLGFNDSVEVLFDVQNYKHN